MTRPLFTGSGLERAEMCPASCALPQVRDEIGNEDSNAGKGVHAFLALVPKVGAESAIELIAPEHRDACAAIDLARIPIVDGAGFVAEVAFAFDYETGTAREIGRDIGRAYGPLGPTEIPLTVDVGALGKDGESVFVGDYKTGRGHTTPARRNAQLKIGALAAARAWGRERAEVALVHVVGTDVYFDHASLDMFDLEAATDDVALTAAAVLAQRELVQLGRTPDVVAGPWCRYCPAFNSCPAKTGLLRTLVEAPSHIRGTVSSALQSAEDPMGDALDAKRAAQAYGIMKRAKEVVDRAFEQLYAYATEHGGIPLDDGAIFGPVRSAKEYVEGNIVHAELEKLYGREIAERACSYDSSKEDIKKALRYVVNATPGLKITHVFDAAIEAIRLAGGIDRRETVTVKEHYPRSKKEIAS